MKVFSSSTLLCTWLLRQVQFLRFNFLREEARNLILSKLPTVLQCTCSRRSVTILTTHRCTQVPICGWIRVQMKAPTFVCLCLQGSYRYLHLSWCWSCCYHHWKWRALCSYLNIDSWRHLRCKRCLHEDVQNFCETQALWSSSPGPASVTPQCAKITPHSLP